VKRRRYGPKRRIRQELLVLATLLAVPAAVVLSFPRQAVLSAGFIDAEPPCASDVPFCGFVVLDEAAEAKATDLVRSVLSVNSRSVRNLRADLSLSTVDEPLPEPVMDVSDRRRRVSPSLVRWDAEPMPPSLAAPEPRDMSGEAEEDVSPFPRDELLRIE